MKSRTHLLFGALGFCVATGCGGAAAHDPAGHHEPKLDKVDKIELDPVLAAKIDTIAADAIGKQNVASVSIAVTRDGKVIFAKGYGFADLEHKVPATALTVYRIGSVTKQFTASAVMQLVEERKLKLDDELPRFLPDYPTHGEHITVRELLTHTSGIYNYTDERFIKEMAPRTVSAADMVAYFSAKPLTFAPGSGWSYSNSGYYLLGVIVEKLSGARYADYLTANIFAKAGLHDTVYCPDEPRDRFDAHGYKQHEGKLEPSDPINMTTPFAAGALCSTVLDLVAWTNALHAKKVVGDASLTAMTTPVQLSTGKTAPYGFGLAIGALGEHREITHGGGINGFMSAVAYFPDDRVAVAVLVNTELDVPAVVLDRVARATLGVPEPTVVDLPLPTDEANHYVGTYELKGMGTLTVTFEQGKLVLSTSDGDKVSLKNQGHGVFTDDTGSTLTFSDGLLAISHGGMELKALKLP